MISFPLSGSSFFPFHYLCNAVVVSHCFVMSMKNACMGEMMEVFVATIHGFGLRFGEEGASATKRGRGKS
jgi:hypothetical protein